MRIRAYTPSDRSACIRIFKSNVPEFFDPAELAQFEAWLDEKIMNTSDQDILGYYVLEDANELVGCGGFCLDRVKNQAGMIWGMIARE